MYNELGKTELINRLNHISEILIGYEDRIAEIVEQMGDLELTKNEIINPKKMEELNTKLRLIKEEETKIRKKWCEIVLEIVKDNVSVMEFPILNVDKTDLVSVSNGINVILDNLPSFGTSYNLTDFSNVSSNMIEQYADLIVAQNDLLLDALQKDSKLIGDSRYYEMLKYLEEYRIDCEGYVYEIDGQMIAAVDGEAIETIYNEVKKRKEITGKTPVVEIAEGTLLSETDPELLARFEGRYLFNNDEVQNEYRPEINLDIAGKIAELKSDVKVVFSRFVNSGKKAIKYTGSKVVAKGKGQIEKLKNYFSASLDFADSLEKRYNYENSFESTNMEVSGYGMREPNYANNLEQTIEPVEPIIQENVQDIIPEFSQPEIIEPVYEEKAAPTIDDTLAGYVKVEETINNNPAFTEEQRKQMRDNLWADFDNFVEQNSESSEPTEIRASEVIEPVIQESTGDMIEKMDEFQLEQYISELNLTMDEINLFKDYVKGYKRDYPSASDYSAEKACIKAIVDNREQEQKQSTRTSVIDSKGR